MANPRTKKFIENEFCYEIRDKLHEFMSDEGLNLDNLIM